MAIADCALRIADFDWRVVNGLDRRHLACNAA
jgi:hypothetical protein